MHHPHPFILQWGRYRNHEIQISSAASTGFAGSVCLSRQLESIQTRYTQKNSPLLVQIFQGGGYEKVQTWIMHTSLETCPEFWTHHVPRMISALIVSTQITCLLQFEPSPVSFYRHLFPQVVSICHQSSKFLSFRFGLPWLLIIGSRVGYKYPP